MSTKNITIRIVVGLALGLAVACYYVAYLGCWTTTAHLEGATVSHMTGVYRRLHEYYEKNGRWPESLSVVMGETGIDLTSNLPLLYFPDAKPGTEEILIAQPQPFKVGLWPFVEMKRRGVRADGELVDVPSDERL
jgi:hypothetical protein